MLGSAPSVPPLHRVPTSLDRGGRRSDPSLRPDTSARDEETEAPSGHATIQPRLPPLPASPVPDLEPGQALVRTCYLSVDPTTRIWMSDYRGYMPQASRPDRARQSRPGAHRSHRCPGGQLGDSDRTVLNRRRGDTMTIKMFPGPDSIRGDATKRAAAESTARYGAAGHACPPRLAGAARRAGLPGAHRPRRVRLPLRRLGVDPATGHRRPGGRRRRGDSFRSLKCAR